LADPPRVVFRNTTGGLSTVVVRISSTQVARTFEGNCVLWNRAARRSLRWGLRLASSLLCDFVGGVGTANGVDHMRSKIGICRENL
jgi:hypothetical protein